MLGCRRMALVNVLPTSIPSVFIFLFPLLEAAITATYGKTAKTIDKLPHPVDRDNVKSEREKVDIGPNENKINTLRLCFKIPLPTTDKNK